MTARARWASLLAQYDLFLFDAYGVLVHGESDTAGALLGIQKIVTGLGWRVVAEPVSVIGSVEGRLDDCRELGAVLAATTLGY